MATIKTTTAIATQVASNMKAAATAYHAAQLTEQAARTTYVGTALQFVGAPSDATNVEMLRMSSLLAAASEATVVASRALDEATREFQSILAT